MAYLPLVLLILVALFSSATVVSIIIAIRSSREHHNTIFPMVREVEGIKARQARAAMAVFLVLSAITIGGWVATQQIPLHIPQATVEQATLSQRLISDTQDVNSDLEKSLLINGEVTELPIDDHKAETEIPTNTSDLGSSVNAPVVVLATDTPTIDVPVLPAATPTPESTATLTSIPTLTPTPSPSSTLPPTSTPTTPPTPTFTATSEATPKPTDASPLAEPETPEPTETIEAPSPPVSVEEVSTLAVPNGITIGPIIFAADINERYEAIDPRNIFDAPPERVYAVFPYRGMENGLPLSVIWYYQDQELIRDEYEWRWGRTDHFYAFVNRPAAGKYKIEIRIGSQTMASGNFEVLP